MNVIPFPSAIFSVEGRRDDDTTVDQQALVAAAAGAEAHGSALEGSEGSTPAAAAARGSGSSSDGDDEPDAAPASTGFKLNLGKVAANQVDDAKPVAVPHTPKGELVQGLLAAQGGGSSDSSSEGDDEEPPPASTGFKINLSRVGKNVVDDVKPVAVPHTPKGDVVQGLLAKQRSIGAVVGTARPHVKRAASVATVRPDRCYRLPRGSWAMGSDARLGQDHLFPAHLPGTWYGAGQCGCGAQVAQQGRWWQ